MMFTDETIVVESAALSIPKAGRFLGVSADTVRRLIQTGDVPHVRIGHSIRLRKVDLEAYLAGRLTTEWKPAAGRGRKRKSVAVAS